MTDRTKSWIPSYQGFFIHEDTDGYFWTHGIWSDGALGGGYFATEDEACRDIDDYNAAVSQDTSAGLQEMTQ